MPREEARRAGRSIAGLRRRCYFFLSLRACRGRPHASGRGNHRSRPGVSAVGRLRPHPAGVRLQLPDARRADAEVGRAVHRAPGERRRHHRRPAPRHRERLRGAPPRRGRGHARRRTTTSRSEFGVEIAELVDGRHEALARSTSPPRRTARRRTSARWSSRWRGTSASSSSSSATASTTCARSST